MAFKIIYWPNPPLEHRAKGSILKDTATHALWIAESLLRSGDHVEIEHTDRGEISLSYLRMLATQEQGNATAI